jgi:hypothetical protein
MTDYVWPDDLVPFAMSFYLQPHTGGSESPFSRVTKIYGLSAPRWICAMSFRGGYNGTHAQQAFGPRLDAMIATLKGRQNRVAIRDFRRDRPRSPHWPRTASNLAAALGATTMTITGLAPGTLVYAGDYLGGDGRPHIITSADFGAVAAVANTAGQAVVTFEPPFSAAVGAGAALFGDAAGLFKLTSDDAGENGVEVGQLQVMALEFVEDL